MSKSSLEHTSSGNSHSGGQVTRSSASSHSPQSTNQRTATDASLDLRSSRGSDNIQPISSSTQDGFAQPTNPPQVHATYTLHCDSSV